MNRFVLILLLAVGFVSNGFDLRPDGKVDINRASVSELMRVPGMTAIWAGRIVRFRPYRSKLDLLNEGVVSAEIYGRIKDSLVAHRETGSRD